VVLIVCAGAAHAADSDVMATKAPPAPKPKRTGRAHRRLPAEDEPHSDVEPGAERAERSTIAIKCVEEFALNWKFIFVLEAGLGRRCAFFAR
jgi:hypothetical protein